jgi:hypothetical protein
MINEVGDGYVALMDARLIPISEEQAIYISEYL